MNVFKKLKDVLFDIEEEIPVITKEENEEMVSDNNPIKEVKMPKEEREIEQELPVKAEEKVDNRFNFPFDLEEEVPIRSRERDFFDDEPAVTSRTTLREKDNFYNDIIEKEEDNYEYDYSRLNVSEKKEEKKTFKISPIISPVYGILDQNYTKDDVIVRSESKKNPSLDEVRKKAYGSKKKVQKEEEKDEFEEPLRTLDEILIDKEEDTKEIPMGKDKIVEEEPVKKEVEEEIDYLKDPVVDEEPIFDDELPDEPYADEVQEEKEEESGIESDLFNLIDSMYEERNERVAEE